MLWKLIKLGALLMFLRAVWPAYGEGATWVAAVVLGGGFLWVVGRSLFELIAADIASRKQQREHEAWMRDSEAAIAAAEAKYRR